MATPRRGRWQVLVAVAISVSVYSPVRAGDGPEKTASTMAGRLERLVLPSLSFVDTPLTDVCARLNRRFFQTATGDVAMGFRLVASPAVGERAVTALCLDRVPLHEVLRFVCARSGTTLRWDADTGVLALMAVVREGLAGR